MIEDGKGFFGHSVFEIYDLLACEVEPFYWQVQRTVLDYVKEFVEGSDFSRERPPRILDLGCGTGNLIKLLSSSLNSFDITGVDSNEKFLIRANEKLGTVQKASVNSMLHFEHKSFDSFFSLPVKANFDVVVSTYVLHNFPPAHRRRAVEGVRNVLSNGGIFINGDLYQCGCPWIDHFENCQYEKIIEQSIKKDAVANALSNAGFRVNDVHALLLEHRTKEHFLPVLSLSRAPDQLECVDTDESMTLVQSGFSNVRSLYKQLQSAVVIAE